MKQAYEVRITNSDAESGMSKKIRVLLIQSNRPSNSSAFPLSSRRLVAAGQKRDSLGLGLLYTIWTNQHNFFWKSEAQKKLCLID